MADGVFAITDSVQDLAKFSEELSRGVSFVTDREDFCRILMSEDSVYRGSLEVWQLPSNYPSRLAEALVLSRFLARADLERDVLERIHSAPATNMFGKTVSAVQSVRRWLGEYSRDLAIEVDLDPTVGR
ncbi:hypothetical protein HGK34_15135 [Myceligenerans sp. I2]|uniref:Uncharacterized protein n=1 Tax=Myceligenerans indicum TaxID=2593663 RepID=A0ABS1LP85_9MICO|nr:hypothetical protein [Myceligenerans indicum]